MMLIKCFAHLEQCFEKEELIPFSPADKPVQRCTYSFDCTAHVSYLKAMAVTALSVKNTRSGFTLSVGN